MKIIYCFNDRLVEWILPKDVKKLCVHCSSSNYKPSDYDAFGRGKKSAPKNIQVLYNKFSIQQPRGKINEKSSGLNNNKSYDTLSHSRFRSKPTNKSHMLTRLNLTHHLAKATTTTPLIMKTITIMNP